MPLIGSTAGGSARGFGFAGKKGLGPYNLLATINNSGTYTVPNNISKLTVIIRGAGNNGDAGGQSQGYVGAAAGAGGQGGTIMIANEVPVTAGSTYNVTIATSGMSSDFGTNLVTLGSGRQNVGSGNAVMTFYGIGGTGGNGGGSSGNVYTVGPAGGAGGAGGNGANAVPTGYVGSGLPTVQASGGGGGGGGGGSFSGPGGNGAVGAGGSLYGAAGNASAGANTGGGGGGGNGGNQNNGYFMGNAGASGGTGGSAQILIYGAI